LRANSASLSHVEDRRAAKCCACLIAEAPRFPELADRYHQESCRPLDMLRQAIRRGMDRASSAIPYHRLARKSSSRRSRWSNLCMIMFDDRKPLDMKAFSTRISISS